MAAEVPEHQPDIEHPAEVLRLGYWRHIGRCAFDLVQHLDPEPGGGPETWQSAGWTLVHLSELDVALTIAQGQLGDDLASTHVTRNDFGSRVDGILDRLYGYGPLAKSELQSLNDDNRQLLTAIALTREGTEREALDALTASLDSRLRGYAERTQQWLNVGVDPEGEVDRTGQASTFDGDDEWMRLPEGPRQVRRAALALFHYLADDRWLLIEDPEDYTPPGFVLNYVPWGPET